GLERLAHPMYPLRHRVGAIDAHAPADRLDRPALDVPQPERQYLLLALPVARQQVVEDVVDVPRQLLEAEVGVDGDVVTRKVVGVLDAALGASAEAVDEGALDAA